MNCFISSFIFIFVTFQVIGYIQANELYNILDKNSTWMNASRSCPLAVPAIYYHNNDILSVDISHDVVTEKLWVGYYLEATAFQYVGCMPIGSHKALASLRSITPGRCQTLCGRTMYIGITRTSCFCIEKKNINSQTNIRHSYCNDVCSANIVCGGKKYMSLYKIVKEPANIIFHTGKCLKFENNPDDRHFEWLECRTFIKTICSFDNGTVSLLDDDSRPWNASIQECLRNKGQSTSYDESLTVLKGTGPVWTGLISGNVIYHINASTRSHSFSNTTRFGYVSKGSDDRIRLQFGFHGERFRALCTSAPNQGTAGIGVSVGVAVPVALLLIAGVVTAFVILKRRRNIPNMCKRNVEYEDPSYTDTKVTTSGKVLQRAHVNQAYDHYDVADQHDHSKENMTNDTDSKHTYFVLEKQAKEPEDNNATYNTVLTGQCSSDIETTHIYNTAESDANTTYDCTSNSRKNVIQKRDDTYDSAEKVMTGNSSDSTYRTDDDMYNHLENNQQQKGGKTDNLYGVPNQLKNSIENADGGFDKNDQSDEDTYNHLNGNSVISTKLDNVYGVPKY